MYLQDVDAAASADMMEVIMRRLGLALALAGIPHKKGGVQAAIDYLITAHSKPARAAAE